MRELYEVLWRSGHSIGEPTKRQEGMAAMQALLGKLPREAKRKLTKAEVSTKAQPAPTQVVVISGGELQATVFFRFTDPESLVIVAEFGAKAKTFKGAPGQAQQLGTQAGTWLRKLLLASKKKTKREGTETMLDKLLQEMREQVGLDEEQLEEGRSQSQINSALGMFGDINKRLMRLEGSFKDLLKKREVAQPELSPPRAADVTKRIMVAKRELYAIEDSLLKAETALRNAKSV